MGDLFDGLEDAEAARDEALSRVGTNTEESGPFMTRGLSAIGRLVGDFTGEEVRKLLAEQGIAPHHHNAWGALIAGAIKLGLLLPTGQYRKMRGPRSHARRTQVLRAGSRKSPLSAESP